MEPITLNADFKSKLPDNRLLRVVFNADMRNGHNGLSDIAKKLNVDVYNMKVGEFVAFVNTKQTHLKLFASGNTIAHFKMPGQRRMNLKTIALIPKFFNGKELRYNDALKEVLSKEMKLS